MKFIIEAIGIVLLLFMVTITIGCKPENNPDDIGIFNEEISGTYNGHDYVDLGTIIITPDDDTITILWATCNVGADNPEDYGDYFAWGEISPKDTSYYWDTYKYSIDTLLTKYCTNYYSNYGFNGYYDDLTVLQSEDDAATANWGEGWCIPTSEQWKVLKKNTRSVWTARNGIEGRLFIASNGNSIFLPAAGYRYDGKLMGVGTYGSHCSSSLAWNSPYSPLDTYYFAFANGDCAVNVSYRYIGRSVRPVRIIETRKQGKS